MRASNALTKRKETALERPKQAEARIYSSVANIRGVKDLESLRQ